MVEAKLITCPACSSQLSVDGGTLHKRSPRLRELEEMAALIPKLKGRLDELEKANQTSKAQPVAPKAKRKPRAPRKRVDDVRKGKEEPSGSEAKPEWDDW